MTRHADADIPAPVGHTRLSRRAFVRATAIAGGALSLGGVTLLAPGNARPAAAADLDHAAFARLVGETFRVRHDAGGSVELALVLITNHGPLATTWEGRKRVLAGTESFTVVFSGRREQALTEGTYHFAHPRVGEVPLFITPMGTAPGRQRYAAVFTVLPPEARRTAGDAARPAPRRSHVTYDRLSPEGDASRGTGDELKGAAHGRAISR